MHFVIRPDSEFLRANRYTSLAHVPFLVADDGTYPAEANRYLRARSLCEWALRLGTDAPEPVNRPQLAFLTVASCISTARLLKTFLNWIEITDRNWRQVDYRNDLLAWQEGLRKGTASESRRPISAAAINLLIAEACYFLTWASLVPKDEHGEASRGPFLVPVDTVRVSIRAGRSSRKQTREVDRRGAQLQSKTRRSIALPSNEQVAKWMRAMRLRFEVKSLMAELILDAGIRISEANQMEVDTLPPKSKWIVIGGKLQVWIHRGVKGKKVTPDSVEAVRGRWIAISLDVAEKIDHYCNFTREFQLRQWIRNGKTKEEQIRRARSPKPKRLWLSEDSNQPFNNVQLYRAWTETAHCPENWHPHKGREWFCVEKVVQWLRDDLKATKTNRVPELTWLQGAMREQVKILLQPELGHASDETTMLYLRAAHLQLIEIFGSPTLRWQEHCDQD